MFALLNSDTNPTKTSANMTHTNTQKKSHKKTPYEAPSGDKNTKKMKKVKKITKTNKFPRPRRGHVTFRVTSTLLWTPTITTATLTKLKKKLLPPQPSMKLTFPMPNKLPPMTGKPLNWHKGILSSSTPITVKEKTSWKKRSTWKAH